MSAFKAVMKVVACTVLGAVFGVILFVFAGYPLLLAAAGGRDMNGGIAMGMVTGVAPLGLFIGGFAGFAIGLRWAVARPQDRRPFTARRKYTIAGVLAALVVVGFAVSLLRGNTPRTDKDQGP